MEIIWTSSATEYFLSAEARRPAEFAAALDGALSLLKTFPEMGAAFGILQPCYADFWSAEKGGAASTMVIQLSGLP